MSLTKSEPPVPSSLVSFDGNLPAPITRYQERVRAVVDERIPDDSLPLRLAMMIEAGRSGSEDLHSQPRRSALRSFRRAAVSFAAVLVLVVAFGSVILLATPPRSANNDQEWYASLKLVDEWSFGPSGTPHDAVRVIVFRQATHNDKLWLIGQASADGSSQKYTVINQIPRQRGTYTFAIVDQYTEALRRDTIDYETLRGEMAALWVMRSSGEQSAQAIDRLRIARTRERTLPAVAASRPLVLRAS